MQSNSGGSPAEKYHCICKNEKRKKNNLDLKKYMSKLHFLLNRPTGPIEDIEEGGECNIFYLLT